MFTCRRGGQVGPVARSSPCGARILDTAEGVLIALRGCSLNQAFVEIVQTAKAHNVSTLSLADALVAIAQTPTSLDVDDGRVRRRPRHLGPSVRPQPAKPRRAANAGTTRTRTRTRLCPVLSAHGSGCTGMADPVDPCALTTARRG
jgi:hypothetical protein